ncbi:MAG: hypothetical protein Q4P78_08600, partial [Rothia sp. (in: high G+C Gram-positive bacteria)]|uniref:hypothetical protein n=1 Tax=Rothia sp. (in: high G+C Gram-positive bacteria) TaxID=1885016 RepID=UPI0026DEA2D1
MRKIAKALGILLATPVVLFLLLAVLIYIPPVQNFVVHQVAASLSQSMGITVRIDKVRLAFPLDLAVHHVLATEAGDTLLDARSLRLNIALRPLFSGRADVEGVELYRVKLNTKSLISDVQLKGEAGLLTAAAHGVDWTNEKVHIDHVQLRDADFMVMLSDTAAKDTTKSQAKWDIRVDRATIERSRIKLSMPGDSMRIGADLPLLTLHGGRFDTGRNHYAVRSLELRQAGLTYDLPYLRPTTGIDPNPLAVSDLTLLLDTLSYQNDQLRTRLRGLTLREKSGLSIRRLMGSVYLDSTRISLPDLSLHTPYSRMDAQVALDFHSFSPRKGGQMQVGLDARIGRQDLLTLGQAYVPLAYLKALPQAPITLKAQASGNIDRLQLKSSELLLPGIASLTVKGHVQHVTQPARSGKADLLLRTQRLSALMPLLPKSLRQTLSLPNVQTLRATATLRGDTYGVNLSLQHGGGTLTARAQTNTASQQ